MLRYGAGKRFGRMGLGVPQWVLFGASLDMDFADSLYYSATGTNTVPGLISTSRASNGYAQNLSGLLILFGPDTPRITNIGLLIEMAATNVALWCRDLTNAVWIKVTMTVALNQIGADGSATSATLLTATAGNATCLQTIVLGSSARFQTAYIKRITGSGVIQMTTDGGTTWTTVAVTASYTQLSIPTQTLANPIIGFRIVTNGDAIAVDFVQNETGAFGTSPILTTTTAATRAADNITLTATSQTAGVTAKAAFAQTNIVNITSSPRIVDFAGPFIGPQAAGSGPAINNGTVNVGAVLGSGSYVGVVKQSFVFDGTNLQTVGNNGTPGTIAGTWAALTPINIGNRADLTRGLNGYLARLTFFNDNALRPTA